MPAIQVAVFGAKSRVSLVPGGSIQLEAPMPVSLKVPDHLANQAEGLIQHLQSEAVTRAGRGYKRNDVLLMALQKGLAVLERELTEIDQQVSGPENRETGNG